MFIGNLADIGSNVDIKYSYTKRNSHEPYPPTLRKESAEGNSFGTDGKLFTDHIGFGGFAILYGTVDINFSLGDRVFLDHIELSMADGSELGEISVVIREENKERIVGITRAETGKTLSSPRVTVSVGEYTDHFTLRIVGECKNIVIGKLAIYGASDLDQALYPLPKSIELKDGFLKDFGGIVADSPDAEFAGAVFLEKYAEKFGDVPTRGEKNVIFCIADMQEEDFTVKVNTDSALIEGGSRRALLWAAEKLLQLAGEDGIRCAELSDSPFMRMRGVHLALPERDKLPFLKNMVKYVFMPMGYNQLILQLSGAMESKRHPKINEAWLRMCEKYEKGEWPLPAHYNFIGHDVLTQDEVRELCDYIRDFGIDVIPEVQSFGHTQHITMAYPHLSELTPCNPEEFDLTNEDAMPDDFYPHTMCPNHEDYYKVIFDLIDEAIEVVRPRNYLHIGHDEIYTIGFCDKCKGTPPAEILTRELTALNDHIRSKGLTTMMWSDMLHEKSYRSNASDAIATAPKDIICLCFTWYFHMDENNENVLYDNGYNVMIGNFYSSHFPRFNERKHRKDLLGAEVSTWVPCNELYYAYEGKLYDFVYSASMLWNEVYFESMRRTYTEIVKNVILNLQNRLINREISENAERIDITSSKLNILCELPEPFNKAAEMTNSSMLKLPLSGLYDRIAILSATDRRGVRRMWEAPNKLGEVVFEYGDGSSASADILYAVHTAEYKRTYGAPLNSDHGTSPFRHQGYFATCCSTPVTGKTAFGDDFTLCRTSFANPNPEKPLRSVTVRKTANDDLSLLIFDITAEQAKHESTF